MSDSGEGEEVDSALEPPEEASPADTLTLARQSRSQTSGLSNCERIKFLLLEATQLVGTRESSPRQGDVHCAHRPGTAAVHP